MKDELGGKKHRKDLKVKDSAFTEEINKIALSSNDSIETYKKI